MLLAPFIRRVRSKTILALLVLVGGILGDLPDLIGVYGTVVRHDGSRLYHSAHAGAIKDILQYIPMYWLHLRLDSYTQHIYTRWGLWNDYIRFEIIAWTINIVLIVWFAKIYRRQRDLARAAQVGPGQAT